MAPRSDDDDFFGFDADTKRDRRDVETTPTRRVTPYDFTPIDPIDAKQYVGSMFRTLLYGVRDWTGALNLEAAPAPPEIDQSSPRSWRIPATGMFLPEFGANTLFDDGRTPDLRKPANAPSGTRVAWYLDRVAEAPKAPSSNPSSARFNAAQFERPAEPTHEAAPVPALKSPAAGTATVSLPSLDQSDTQSGIALATVANVLRRAPTVLAQFAGGNPSVVKQVIDSLVPWVGSLFPPKYSPTVIRADENASAAAHEQVVAAERDGATLDVPAKRRLESERSQDSTFWSGEWAPDKKTNSSPDKAPGAEQALDGDRDGKVYAAVPGTERETKPAHRTVDENDRVARHRAAARPELGQIVPGAESDVDELIDSIVAAAELSRDWNATAYQQAWLFRQLRDRIDAIAERSGRLHYHLTRGAAAALAAATEPDTNIEDEFIKGATGTSPADRAAAESSYKWQREADKRFQAFAARHPRAGYREVLAAITAVARDTRVLPRNAISFLMPDLAARDRTMSSRLANPEKILAQLEALHAIAASNAAPDSLPESLRDLAADYAAVMRDPSRPLDAEPLIHSIFRRGVPRRVEEVATLAEVVGEVATPYGNIVSLNDARKAAASAHEAFSAGRTLEGSEHSAEAIWQLAMSAPFFANIARGVKRLKLTRQRRIQLKKNNSAGADVEKFVFERVQKDLQPLGLNLVPRKQMHTKHGVTVVDGLNHPDGNLLVIEIKKLSARYKNKQRKRQEELPNAYLFRGDIKTGKVWVTEIRKGKQRKQYYLDSKHETNVENGWLSYEDWKRKFVTDLQKSR